MNELIKLGVRNIFLIQIIEGGYLRCTSSLMLSPITSDQLGQHRTRPSAGITDPIAVH